MLRDRVILGLEAGITAAAATAGVLVGLGQARGAPLGPLNAVAHVALGTRAFLFDGFDPVVTVLGVLLHVAGLLLIGILFALLATGARGLRLVSAAVVFAGAVFLVNIALVPSRVRPGFETTLSTAELVLVYLALALALTLALAIGQPPRGRA